MSGVSEMRALEISAFGESELAKGGGSDKGRCEG